MIDVEWYLNTLDDIESIDEMHIHFEILSIIFNISHIIEIFQCHSLFQLKEMKIEVNVIQRRSEFLMYKFSKLISQSSDHFLSQSIFLSLPTIDELMIVKQLIQLKKFCQWITQKSQHLWFYRRILNESFFLTLLQVEDLFDLTRLSSIFKYDAHRTGAGFCSRSLMDKVEMMIDRMVFKAWHGDNTEERITFDPKEILREQHQLKFCTAVETTLRQYRGKDPYLHMAQHFREVSTHSFLRLTLEIVFRMFFGTSLRRYLQLEECKGNQFVYDRGDCARTTIALRRFLQKLKISRILFRIFGILWHPSMLINRESDRIFSNTASRAIPAMCT